MLAHDRKIPVSKVLIPLSFASQFGGVCTIIGTSTNMLVNGIAIDKGITPFVFFEFAPLGIIMVAAGTIYLIVAGRWLLPKRKGEVEQIDVNRFADYHAELLVTGNSPMVGTKWTDSKLEKESKIKLTNLMREGKAVSRPRRTVIRPGDLLLLRGTIERIIALGNKYYLDMMSNTMVKPDLLSKHKDQLIEVLIPPNSKFIGETLKTSDFSRRFNAVIMAFQRRGRSIKERLEDIEIEEGDTLLLYAHDEDVSRLMSSENTIVTTQVNELSFRKEKAITALLIMLAAMSLAIFNVFPIMIAAIIGALGMIVTRCLTVQEAYDAIDWKIIFLLGGIIPLGLALEQNGAVLWLANNILQPVMAYGPVVIIAALYLITAILTEER